MNEKLTLKDLTKKLLTVTKNEQDRAIAEETRLEELIEAIEHLQNVVDILPDYDALEVYENPKLKNNDKIIILADNNSDLEYDDEPSTVYKYDLANEEWVFFGVLAQDSYSKTHIDAEIERLDEKIDTEETRAKGVEAGLRTDVNANATAISNERTRATGEEARLEGLIDAEQDRAERAEAGLGGRIDTETRDRENADTALGGRITDETRDRENADTALGGRITDETNRAETAESNLGTRITGETNRAEGAEATLQDNINTEARLRESGDADLQAQINDLDLAQVGANGRYIKFVSQENGQVSATDQTFDTTIDSNSNNNNAPTSSAVKTYVDNSASDITSALNDHIQDDTNPHGVTKAQVGLGNVDNTSDLNKPVSTAQQEALDTKQNTIDANNKLSSDVVDDTNKTHKFATAEQLSQIATNTSNITSLRTDLTTHEGDTNNPHSVTKSQVGLGNVENTGDSAVPLEDGTTKFTTGGAYTLQQTLQGNIGAVDNKLNYNVHIESGNEMSYSGDVVTKSSGYRNLKTGVTGTRSEILQLANSTTAGLMSFEDYNQIRDNTDRIAALEGTPVRLVYTASQNPTATDIKNFVDAYLASKGIPSPTDSDYNSVSVKINGTNHIWNYYANNSAYKDDGLDTVTTFTNSIAGIILGTADATDSDNNHINDGKVYAENDGTGSVLGWGRLIARVEDLETTTGTHTQEISDLNTAITGIKDGTSLDSFGDVETALSGKQATIDNSHKLSSDLVDDTNKTHKFATAAQLEQIATNTTAISGIKNGSSINDFAGVETALSGKQATIDSTHKLLSDLVDTTSQTNKFVTASEKEQITTNKDAITGIKNGSSINDFAGVETALSGKQATIDTTHKLSSDLVDDTNKTHKFATAAQLEQIATNTTAITNIKDGSTLDSFGDVETALSGKQATIDSSHKLSSDLVDDTDKTHKFATAAQLEQIATNTTAISGIKNGSSINSFGGVETALAGKQNTIDSNHLLGAGLIDNDRFVRYDTNTQGLTDTQKSNARANIGAGTSSFSGSYTDLTNKPSIPASDSDLTNNRYVRYDTNAQGLNSTQKANARTNIGAGTSSFSGSYNDLTDKPTIPTVSDATITIKQTGISDQTFTLNGGATTITLVDTNTWRGIQDNLTSDSTTDSLSAKQGKLLANGSARDDTKLPLSGGTLSSSTTDTVLNLKSNTTNSYLGFYNSSGNALGWLGVNSSNKPIFNYNNTDYTLAYASDIPEKYNTSGGSKWIGYSSEQNDDPTYVAVFKSNNDTNGLCYAPRSSLSVGYADTAGSATNATNAANLSNFVAGNSDNGEHNANDIIVNGHYYYNANGPSEYLGDSYPGDGALYTQAYSSNWIGEIAQNYRDGSLFVRGKNNGNWTPWKAIANADDEFVMFTPTRMDFNPKGRVLTCNTSTSAWNSGAYSRAGYKECKVTFKAGQTNVYLMAGLNSDPTTGVDYRYIDYCWYLNTNGALTIYESGVDIGAPSGHSTYATGDEFSVEYSNGYVKYYHNGQLARKVARAMSGLLYFQCSHYNGGNIYNVEFNQLNDTSESTDLKWYVPSLDGPAYSSVSTSFIGGVSAGPRTSNSWEFLYRAEHRNGTGDGPDYICEIVSNLTSDSPLYWRKKVGPSSSFTGWRELIDSTTILKYSGPLNENGWKTMGGRTAANTIAISYNNNKASWNSETYSSSLVFGCADTKGLLDCGYSDPRVTFGGGSVNGSTDNNPAWYWALKGTSGTAYDLDTDFIHNSGANPILNDGTPITQPDGANAMSFKTKGTAGDTGIFYLSEDNAYICNSSDNGYTFAVWDKDITTNFSGGNIANASFVVKSNGEGVATRGNVTIGQKATLQYNSSEDCLDFIFN